MPSKLLCTGTESTVSTRAPSFPAVTLCPQASASMDRSELKHELGEWFLLAVLLVLGLLVVVLHILNR
jgi:hypothetical protein